MPRFVLSLVLLVAFSVYSVVVLADENIITYVLALPIMSWGSQVLIDLVIACTLVLIWIYHDTKRQGWGLGMFAPFCVLTFGLGSISLLAYFTLRNYRLMQAA